jgi:galactokinase
MYRIVEGTTAGLADADNFVRELCTLDGHPSEAARKLFDGKGDLIVARAPGRLDVMGGIADYSGSLVLQLPTREATFVALQESAGRVLRIVSIGRASEGRATRSLDFSLAGLEENGSPVTCEDARAKLALNPAHHWAAYVVGIFLILMRERGVRFPIGASILIDSQVPEGKGVSSSAALEVAVMSAVAAWKKLALEPRDAALLCQQAENLVVGAPCGVMDQMTSACGRANRLLALLCQPAELQGHVAIPEGVVIGGIDSGVRHAVTGAAYGEVRTGAFMGYRIIADQAKLKVRETRADGSLHIEDPAWRGYVANIAPSEFEKSFAPLLPKEIGGSEFLARYGGITDCVTRVDGKKRYAVRVPTRHPVHEHFRVRAFAEILQGELSDARMQLLGELMYQSHASYSACRLGEARTDRLVQLCRNAGPARGAFGAKITGGGSGGTVAFLSRGSRETIESIAADFQRETGHAPHQFWGSSPGAAEFGAMRLRATP